MNLGDMPLTVENIAKFLDKARWMAKTKRWMPRLLYRVMKLCLDLLTEKALAAGQEQGKWTGKVKR